MLRLGAKSFPAPNDTAAFPPGVVTQFHDFSRLERQEPPMDTRPPLDKLTIPSTPVYIPEASGSRAPGGPCESAFPLYPPMHHPDRGPRARNVIIFGESGVGKSSVINTIAGKHVTQTSSDAAGCTFRSQCYQVLVDGLTINLWDTVGLDEGTEGTVPAKQAESNLKAFLGQITRWNGIDLLVYCVRGTRVRQALLRNYNIFYAAICRKKVPVALVVTGLENYEGEMEGWWIEHEKDLIKHGMQFDAHACVTTISSDHPAIQDRLKQSRAALRNLVQANFDAAIWWAEEDSLMSTSFPDARALLGASEKRAAPLIFICDATEHTNRIHLFPALGGSRKSYSSDQKYQCLYVDARGVPFGHSKPSVETVQRPDLLIFYADADSELNRIWTALAHFHASFGGRTCPVVIVFGGLGSLDDAEKLWKNMSASHGGGIIASPTYYPGPDGSREVVEKADRVLAALVEDKCLIKFQGKLTRFQKFFRFFFTGRN